jgi:hypothetical protein
MITSATFGAITQHFPKRGIQSAQKRGNHRPKTSTDEALTQNSP